MSNSISDDIISGIKDGLEDLGWNLTLQGIAYGSVNIDNPGAAPLETSFSKDFKGLVFDFDEKYMPGSTVEEGDRMVLVSVDTLTTQEIAAVKPGNYIIDGSEIYSIIKTAPIKVAGATVVVIAQVKG